MTRSDRSLPFSPLSELSPSSLTRSRTSQARTGSLRHSERTHHPIVRLTTLRTRMHPDDKRRIESLCVALSESLRATVRPSNLLRSLLLVTREAEACLHSEARRVHGLERPSNNDREGMEEFEQTLADVLLAAIAARSPRRP